MAKKKVIAHFMHEYEENEIRDKIDKPSSTNSYHIGEMDEDDISSLRDKGIIIEVQDEEPIVITPGIQSRITQSRMRAKQISEPTRGIPSPSFGLSITAPEAALGPQGPEVDNEKPNFYLIQLIGPLIAEWKNQFESKNVKLLECVPTNNYTAKLHPDQVQIIKNLPFIKSVRLYNPEDSGPIESQVTFRATASLPTMAKEAKMLTYDIRLHDHNDLQNILDWLNSKKISIAGSSRRKIRIYMIEDSPHIREIQSLPEVASIEKYIEPTWHNDVSRQLLGIDDKATNPASNISQTGQGQIIGVADTGIDDQHPDFQNRIIGIEALGRQNDPSDTDGHGTHVAGSILGDGLASDGKLRGMAPGAQLYFQSVMDAHGGLGGLPLDIGDLFKQAYQNGARIHNNSWGAAVDSTYTLNSMEVDEFVADHRDMLIVISAGNEGTSSYVANTSKGIVEWISIGSPASCKNALTVGAHRSNRTEGGLSEFSYGEAWPNDFPDSPISDEKVSGDPESLAGFSSRGPCEDTRIKPDVVGPGTDIASCRSKDAPLRHFWGPYPGNKKYAFMGGTSMAAPIVSGCAALVRDYYVNSRNHTPSAALLKATLINGTRWLRGSDATATFSELPNYDQGFGAIYMSLTIPNSSKPKLKLEFLDTWQQPDLQFVNSGDPLRRQISVGSGAPLRFCLVWTDVAGRSLQNDLNLVVENLQTREKWIANKNLPRNIHPIDHTNNIKVIRIENPQPADYYIHLEAFNLLKSPQDCALVITGDLNSQIKPY